MASIRRETSAGTTSMGVKAGLMAATAMAAVPGAASALSLTLNEATHAPTRTVAIDTDPCGPGRSALSCTPTPGSVVRGDLSEVGRNGSDPDQSTDLNVLATAASGPSVTSIMNGGTDAWSLTGVVEQYNFGIDDTGSIDDDDFFVISGLNAGTYMFRLEVTYTRLLHDGYGGLGGYHGSELFLQARSGTSGPGGDPTLNSAFGSEGGNWNVTSGTVASTITGNLLDTVTGPGGLTFSNGASPAGLNGSITSPGVASGIGAASNANRVGFLNTGDKLVYDFSVEVVGNGQNIFMGLRAGGENGKFDYTLSGGNLAAIPLPGAAPLLAAGMGLFGVAGARKRLRRKG